jgi:hypothetical protein
VKATTVPLFWPAVGVALTAGVVWKVFNDLFHPGGTGTGSREHSSTASSGCRVCWASLGGFAAALGGLETLVFSGGIGEHASVVRARICDALAFLGVSVDSLANGSHAPVISREGSRVTVRVIPTNGTDDCARDLSYRRRGMNRHAGDC